MKMYEVTATIKGKQVVFNTDLDNEFMARVVAMNSYLCELEDVAIVKIEGFDVVHLQGRGKVRAKTAAEFRPGERIGYNHNQAHTIFKVMKETAKSITYRLVSMTGTSHDRTFRKTQLVAIAEGDRWS